MKLHLLVSVGLVAGISGCATGTPPPAGMEVGRFVAYDCEGQDFQARFNPESNTVRVRTHHGAAELSAAGSGVYAGDGFKLSVGSGVSIEHDGKVLGRNCRRT
jgi:hypothetical protein